jgi:hypothetical protein
MTKLKLDNSQVRDKAQEVIVKASVKHGLIYRDWQQAIGDIMLEKYENKDVCPYTIIGYKKFEEMWDNGSIEEKKWLERAERIFKNLDLSVSEYSDSRIIQLKNMYSHSYDLLKALYITKVGAKPISKIKFRKIPNRL